MNGILVAIKGQMMDLRGDPNPNVSGPKGDWSHQIDEKAEVTLNGQKVGLGDLRPGDLIYLSGGPAVEVRATRIEPKKPAA